MPGWRELQKAPLLALRLRPHPSLSPLLRQEVAPALRQGVLHRQTLQLPPPRRRQRSARRDQARECGLAAVGRDGLRGQEGGADRGLPEGAVLYACVSPVSLT